MVPTHRRHPLVRAAEALRCAAGQVGPQGQTPVRLSEVCDAGETSVEMLPRRATTANRHQDWRSTRGAWQRAPFAQVTVPRLPKHLASFRDDRRFRLAAARSIGSVPK
jgi:hypothetical protein